MSEPHNNVTVRKQYIEVPPPMTCGLFCKLYMYLKGILLSPIYLFMAGVAGAPGLGFHLRCAAIGLRLLLTGRASLTTCYGLLFSPMDSTRYFEFHEVWKSVKGLSFSRYLDVSSPRLVPLLLLKGRPEATVELMNPDLSDLRETEKLADAMGLISRCGFYNGTLDNAPFPQASFDLITCLSVLEHIPGDTAALGAMWSLLCPGGKLLLTLPCRTQPLEQYISHNPYGVLHPGDDGYTFWQRYYDRERLTASIYSVTGPPTRVAIYGEKRCGFFFRNAAMKRLLGFHYPFWREPYMMAVEYRWFSSPDELPGEGVVLLEFVKPGNRR